MPTTNLTVGLGTLTIDGANVGWLKGDVTYNVTYSMADYATGQPLQVKAKVITEYPKATLKANMAELTNILPFLPSAGVYEMPTYEVVFQTHEKVGKTRVTITFPQAVLTSAGIKMSEIGYTMTDINIEAVGDIPIVTTEVVGVPSVYTVTYNANSGSGGPSDSDEYASGDPVPVKFTSLPTRSGYSFQGWALTSSASSPVYTSVGTTTFNIFQNTTLFAVWKQIYTVTYNANSGSGGPTDANNYVNGDTVTVKFTSLPTRSGYSFQGWAATSNAMTPTYTSGGTTTFVIGSVNVVLYAVWLQVPSYSVSFDGNGGTIPWEAGFNYAVGDTVEINMFGDDPTKPGVTFAGWDMDPSATTPSFTATGTRTFVMPNNAVVLYAIYI